MSSSTTVLLTCVGVPICAFLLKSIYGRKQQYPFPPGPPPNILLGNALDFPVNDLHKTLEEWGRKYDSGIVHASAMGMHFIAVNDRDMAEELFERRASATSDRVDTAVGRMLGWDDYNIAMFPYGDVWRQHRKLCWQHFNPDAAKRYNPMQTEQVYKLMSNIITDPERVFEHVSLLSISLTLRMMFGYEPNSLDDPIIRLAEDNFAMGAPLFEIGNCWITLFPFLRYIPHWFPGAWAQKTAKKCRDMVKELKDIPMAYDEGRAETSMVTDFLEKKATEGASAEEELTIRNVSWTVYAVDLHTSKTTAATGYLLYLLINNPEVQRKAQEELDRVIGPGRLPNLTDRPSLPYIEAVYRELFRCRPPLPTGVPHAMTHDEVYNGYLLPKGALLWGNVWAMTHDPERYPDPDAFKPERFFGDEGKLNGDSRVLAYGFGRRVCVGKAVASETMWLIIACFLTCFNIAPMKDETGKDVPIDDGIVHLAGMTHKKPFKNSISPRNDRVKSVIEHTLPHSS